MQYFFGYTRLLFVFFCGIGVVRINDDRRVFKSAFIKHRAEILQVFVMIVGYGLPVSVHRTAQNGVRKRIALAVDFPTRIHKSVRMPCGTDGVHHDFQISARRIFHSHGNVETACRQSVELIFNRPCSHRNVGKHVGQIKVVFGIKHLVGAGKTRLFQRFYVQFSDCDEPFEHILACVRVGLVQHPFVAVPRRARFVGVYARNDDYFVRNLLLHFAEP